MEWIPRLLATVSATFVFVAVDGWQAGAPTPPPERTLISVPDASEGLLKATPTTAANDAVIPPTARCGQWWGLALEAGWTQDLLPTLDKVLWRESNCLPHVHNTTLNKDGSSDIGLTQINDRSWCLPTRWYPTGYLQHVGTLRSVGCEELFDPVTNLKAAKALYDYSLEQNGNGWQPWRL